MRLLTASLACLWAPWLHAQNVTSTIPASDHPRRFLPAAMTLSEVSALTVVQGVRASGKTHLGQLDTQSILAMPPAEPRLYWIQPVLPAGAPLECELTTHEVPTDQSCFEWVETADAIELRSESRPIFKRMRAYDKNAHEATKRAFDHLYGFDGELLTKGDGGDYPHHRGVFLGFNQTKVADGTVDFWHLKDGSTIQWRRSEARIAMNVFARDTEQLEWCTKSGESVLRETRRVTVWAQPPGRQLLDFEILLRPVEGAVALQGDPHHAGFHIRLNLPEKKTTADYTRTVGAKLAKDDIWDYCEHAAAKVPTGKRDYVVLLCSHPANGSGQFSTRPYGRFGWCAAVELAAKKELLWRFRILIVDANLHPEDVTAAGLAAIASDFANPLLAVPAK